MIRNMVIGLAFCLVALGSHANAASFKVDPAAQQAGGVVVQTLSAVQSTPSRNADGLVLDPGTLIALRSQIQAAQAGKTVAAQALSRARQLYRAGHNIAMAQLQRAEAANATAAARTDALSAKARAAWGPVLGKAVINGAPIIQALSKVKEALIEVAVTGPRLKPPTSALARVGDARPVQLHYIGPASRVPSGIIGQGFYYRGPASLPIGLPLSVRLAAGSAQTGVVVPATAILYLRGQKFVVREIAANQFALVPISAVWPIHRRGQPMRDFIGKGLQPGDQVVVAGAGVMLSAAPQG